MKIKLTIISLFLFVNIFGQDIRGLVDTVGFSHTEEQINQAVKHSISYLGTKNLKKISDNCKNKNIVGIICPHDDHIYAGPVYIEAMQAINAKIFIIFGVAHKAWKWGIQDKLIFDNSEYWKGPFANIKTSHLRKQILQKLNKNDYIVSNKYQSIEHSIEGILPWIQYKQRNFQIIPILVPYMNWQRMNYLSNELANIVYEVLKNNNLQLGKDVQIILSNDGSHYGDQDWGGKNYAPFGCDIDGYKKATSYDISIAKKYLCNTISQKNIHKLLYTLVDSTDVHNYKVTWCGRFSITFGTNFLLSLYKKTYNKKMTGEFIDYNTSVAIGELPLRQYGLGTTAPSNLHHWVGYLALFYY